jgi:hypothetical protein
MEIYILFLCASNVAQIRSPDTAVDKYYSPIGYDTV